MRPSRDVSSIKILWVVQLRESQRRAAHHDNLTGMKNLRDAFSPMAMLGEAASQLAGRHAAVQGHLQKCEPM
jgi:hypothetical protein